MATIEREFYRSSRGPAPRDEDAWRLVFDRATGRLIVRHEWEADRHSGLDELPVAEFLAEQGAPQTALLTMLFGEATADA